MVLVTMIARLADGLPLAASMQEDEQSGRSFMEYQNQAKMLFKKLNQQSPTKCSIESGPMVFHYLIEVGVVYLVLCEKQYAKRLAFAYLEELQQEFYSQYSKKVSTVTRPYSFIEFDTYIQKLKKSYTDTRARRNISHINTELQDVQRIMVQNIDDVMQRGVALSDLDNKASNLSSLSKKYKQDAKYLNLRSRNAKIAAVITLLVVFLIYLRYWWF
ncbi:vesicle-trafficking protein SEC22b-like [Acanthaster planci]|uniref:Vesicle-trafficking protein SEC22b n=1 Tax=Acanthaster planci TaxID=133434 RepID=A0A8B7ZRB3_ACAPL|nr:vesicle-trafficking protein SEC22b-like [Acanthaster planci]